MKACRRIPTGLVRSLTTSVVINIVVVLIIFMLAFGHVPRACVFQCPRLGVSVDMVRAHKSSISVAVSGGDPLAQRILGERLLNLLGA